MLYALTEAICNIDCDSVTNLVILQLILSVKCLFQATRDYSVVVLLAGNNGGHDSSCTDGQLTLRALINRSLMYLQRGDHGNALCDLLSVAELSPLDKTVYQTLGVCYHKLDIFHCGFFIIIISITVVTSSNSGSRKTRDRLLYQ